MTTLLGPMLPVLSARWALTDAHAGYLFTAQFTGSMLGVAISDFVVQRFGYRISLVAGLCAMAAGATVLAHSPWVPGLVAVFGYGAGIGLTIPTSNFLIAEWNAHRRAAALNWLNFCWGIGAAACPFAVAALVASHRTPWFLLGVATALLLLGIALAVSPGLWPEVPRLQQSGKDSGVWRDPFVLLLGSLFFLYVGTENSIGGWIASYTQRIQAAPGARWALAPSLFWGALLAGRGLAPGFLKLLRERELARLGLLVAACGVTILLAARSADILLLAVTVTGLGLSSVFSIYIALLASRFGKTAPGVRGAMFALGGLGGATLPWLVGALSTQFGALKAGLYVPLFGCLTMLALYFLASAGGHSPQES